MKAVVHPQLEMLGPSWMILGRRRSKEKYQSGADRREIGFVFCRSATRCGAVLLGSLWYQPQESEPSKSIEHQMG